MMCEWEGGANFPPSSGLDLSLLTGSFMSASVFTATEGTVTKLALILLLRSGGLLGRRVAGRPGSRGSHLCGKSSRIVSGKNRKKRRWYCPLGNLAPVLKACRRQEFVGMSDHSLGGGNCGKSNVARMCSLYPATGG